MKNKKTVEEHEDKYIHIPKNILYIFSPLILIWYTIIFIAGLIRQIVMFIFMMTVGTIMLIPRSTMDEKERKEMLDYWSGKFSYEYFENIHKVMEKDSGDKK